MQCFNFCCGKSAKCKEIIDNNRDQLQKIVSPGLQSAVAGSIVDPKILEGHTNSVREVVISRCGKYIITKTRNKIVRIWDLRDSNRISYQLLNNVDKIHLVALSKYSNYIVVAYKDNTARIWDIRDFDNRKTYQLIGHKDVINLISISGCDRYIVTISKDNTARIWDVRDLNNIKSVQFYNKANNINLAMISKYGNYIVAITGDNIIRIWNIQDLQNIKSVFLKTNSGVDLAAINDHGKLVLRTQAEHKEYKKITLLYDFSDFNNIKSTLLIGHNDSISKIAISECGKYIVTSSWDNTARVWDIRDLSNIKSVVLTGHSSCVYSAEISKCNKYVITGADDETVRIWDISDLDNIKSVVLRGHKNWINAIAISDFGQYIATASCDKTAIKWDIPWVMDNLDLEQLQKLEKLIEYNNPAEVLEFYENNKKNFSKNLGYYIELYLRNKFIEFYLTSNNQISASDIQQLICSYLEISTFNAASITNRLNINACAQCNKENCHLRCTRCKQIFYCSRGCQKAHWDSHKLICQ